MSRGHWPRDRDRVAYDDAGNAQEIEAGLNAKRRYTHDAWNRLVKIENGTVSGGTTTWTTTGQYQYNALHWRVVADGDRAAPTGPVRVVRRRG